MGRPDPTEPNGWDLTPRRRKIMTYRKREGHVWLMPHNPGYDPIPGDNASIVGKVVAVLRRA